MSHDWEDAFKRWAAPLSASEQQKCENAEGMVRKAISASEALSKYDFRVFVQGSYKNNTNVRQNSDVDVCICLADVFFSDFDFAAPYTREQAGLVDAGYTYVEFKSDVEIALKHYFGTAAVTRGNKAFDVHANSYRVDADVVACFTHRRYGSSGGFTEGTELRSDDGKSIINWPKQHHRNGVDKNTRTGSRYKKLARIFKGLRNKMNDEGIQAAEPIPSFLCECLIWNVPDSQMGASTLTEDVKSAIVYLYNNTKNEADCHEWGEVSELKYLFRAGQPWTYQQANQFLIAAWAYLGY